MRWKSLVYLSGVKGLKRSGKVWTTIKQPDNQQLKEVVKNVETVRQLFRSDRWLSVQMMAEELNLNREMVRKILTDDLGTRKFSAKMLPRILSDEQK